MKYAKVENGTVAQVGTLRELFPYVSFPATGPDNETMDVLGVYPYRNPGYNTSTQQLDYGQPVVDTQARVVWAATVVELPYEARLQLLNERRRAVWEQIKEFRDSRMYAGVQVGEHWFHTDNKSRIQQLGLRGMGNAMPALQWKVMNNGHVPMTPQLAEQIFWAVAQLDATVHQVAEVHKAAVYASTNPESVDWSGGWPASFEGPEV